MIFQNFKTIRSFRRDIYSKIFTLNDALEEEINLKDEIDKFKESTKLENQEKRKELTFENAIRLLNGRQKVLNSFKWKIFPKNKTKGKEIPWNVAKPLKILTPKQMLQNLLIALAQENASTTSEKFLNEIRHVVSSLNRAKEITKKAYTNIINLINI